VFLFKGLDKKKKKRVQNNNKKLSFPIYEIKITEPSSEILNLKKKN